MRGIRPGEPATLRDRLLSRAVIDFETGCWLWMGVKVGGGYGRIVNGGARLYAHRALWEIWNGMVPKGLDLDHLCRVRHCINPAHLEPVTRQVNVLRGVGFAATFAARTHCKHGHEYTPENTNIRKDGSRQCRSCKRERARRSYANRKVAA